MIHVFLIPKITNDRITGVTDSCINEATRMDLIKLAKTTNRYNRKPTSGVKYKQLNAYDIIEGSQNLDVTLIVKDYIVTVRFENFMTHVRSTYSQLKKKSGGDLNKSQMKTAIARALVSAMSICDIKVNCTCSDFKYRYAYVATIGDYKLGEPETRPAGITNPSNSGSMCKHLSAVLGLSSKWQSKIVNDMYKILQYKPQLLTK